MKNNKLIYITNTRLPSEKANCYQSVQMCHSFAKIFSLVELWVPKSHNTKELEKVKNIYKFYDINNNFAIKRFFQFDSKLLKFVNEFIWANSKALIFALNVVYNLLKLKNENYIYRGKLEAPKGEKTKDWKARNQLLFKSTIFGDDTDRPLQKADGAWTYFAGDLAYHNNKIERNFD